MTNFFYFYIFLKLITMKVKFKIKFLKLFKKSRSCFLCNRLKIILKRNNTKNFDFQTDVYAEYNKRIKITD